MKPLLIVILVLFFSGCASVGVKPIEKKTEGATIDPSKWVVDTRDIPPITVHVTFQAVDGDRLARQAHQSANQAGAVGLIGALVATQMSRSTAEHNAQVKANSPVNQLIMIVHMENNTGLWARAFSEQSENVLIGSGGDKGYQLQALEEEELRVVLKPSVFLTGDYRSLHLNVISELHQKNGEIVYRKEFDYLSKPIVGKNKSASEVWNFEFERFEAELVQAANSVRDLIELDVHSFLRSAATSPRKSKAIRYRNISGSFYERGEVLSHIDDRMVFRTLRGGVKSVYAAP